MLSASSSWDLESAVLSLGEENSQEDRHVLGGGAVGGNAASRAAPWMDVKCFDPVWHILIFFTNLKDWLGEVTTRLP